MEYQTRNLGNLLNKLFLNYGIADNCKSCTTCCNSYGFLMIDELSDFHKQYIDYVQIGKNVFCVNCNILKETEKIPICSHYLNNRCNIYEFRPFICSIYPLIIRIIDNKLKFSLDLSCEFLKEIEDIRLKKLANEIISCLKQNIAESYDIIYDSIKKIDEISNYDPIINELDIL